MSNTEKRRARELFEEYSKADSILNEEPALLKYCMVTLWEDHMKYHYKYGVSELKKHTTPAPLPGVNSVLQMHLDLQG